MPRLEPIWKKYRDQGLSIVAIDINQRGKAALKFIEEKNLSYIFLETHVGPDDPMQKVFNVKALPVNMIVNNEGKILFLHDSFTEGDEVRLENEIRIALGL